MSGVPPTFANWADEFHRLGIAIIPCGGDDGKRALRKWTIFQRFLPYERVIDVWKDKHPEANIGLITGAVSGITVVDCDDPTRSVESLLREYGRTPFVVRSPSGGLHLYYRYNGENSHAGYKPNIDIRGNGGLIIAPHSINPISGKEYEVIQGTLDELRRLPLMREGAYMHKEAIRPRGKSKANGSDKDGCEYRNDRRFMILKNNARHIPTFEELLDFAHSINNTEFDEPSPESEVIATAKQVWRYKQEKRLLDGTPIYTVSKHAYDKLKDEPAALVLYMDLIRNHFDREDFFILTTPNCVPARMGWGIKKLNNAIKVLLEQKFIKRVGKRRPEGSTNLAYVYVLTNVPKDT